MMRDFDMTRSWDCLIGGWELDGGWVKDHFVPMWLYLYLKIEEKCVYFGQ
jgi:hypothetical protein